MGDRQRLPHLAATAGVLWSLLVATAAAQLADLPGWREARWGMNAADLQAAFPDTLNALPGRWEYGRAYADYALFDAEVGGLSFDAFFQMNKQSDRLEQVLLERRRAGATPVAFARLLTALEETYGPPAETCRQINRGGNPGRYELIWRFPTTTLHASFLDFSSTEVLTRDPEPPAIPLSETVEERLRDFLDERRITHRFVPRRILIRAHASDNSALGTGCP